MDNIDYKKIFEDVLAQNQDNPKWEVGDFVGVKTVSNTKVGNVGQDFIEELCNKLSIPCKFPMNKDDKRANQSPWDIEIIGVKFELKTATEDINGNFQFNHLRYHRPYDAVLCLGVSPNNLYFGIWSKADITTGQAGRLVSMEKQGNASYKLTKNPSNLMAISDFENKIKSFTDIFFTK